MTVNIPSERVMVDKAFLTDKETGLVLAYLIAARCLPCRPILFTVHLENGAVYAGLPISAIHGYETKNAIVDDVENLQPWSCLSGPVQFIKYTHLNQYDVEVPKLERIGRYIGTIDYHGDGLAEDPEQHKSHNLILPDEGPLMAMPNNYCLFKDAYFTKDIKIPLTRQTQLWRTK